MNFERQPQFNIRQESYANKNDVETIQKVYLKEKEKYNQEIQRESLSMDKNLEKGMKNNRHDQARCKGKKK